MKTLLHLLLCYFVFVITSKTIAQENTQENIQDPAPAVHAPNIVIDGNAAGWQPLSLEDFVNVNCKDDTWTEEKGTIKCKGNCVGVIRSKEQYENLELMLKWRHLEKAGNSGVFVWSSKESLDALKPKTNGLPHGIEVQVLDLGYKQQYEQGNDRKADWFTCHGDVFPVGDSTMKPFPPIAPNGRRSFPSSNHTKDVGQWNHYYIRAINGEIRLWVNGHEVSGGNQCHPSTGYFALEAEGAPIEFRDLKFRIVK